MMNAHQQVLTAPHPMQWLKDTSLTLSRGESSNLATVADQSETTLAAFVQQQISTVREGRLNAADYQTADKETRNADKAPFGWYSFAAYTGQHRNKANWLGSKIVVLDADATVGGVTGAEYAFGVADLKQRLAGLHYIALPTHSHTDDIPRWRVLILLTETITDRDEHSQVARSLAGLLDGYVDPRSYTPEQLWYNLSAPADEWQNRRNLILVATSDSGQQFDVLGWRETKPAANVIASKPVLTLALSAPLPETPENIERVEGMLAASDPDSGDAGTRDPWMRKVWSVESLGWSCGNGANGKSVFFNVLGSVLADYAIVVPAATLMVKRDGEAATNDIARMAGARFAVANETKSGDKLDDQKLKQLASRDRIAARFLYGEYFEFDPSATVWVRGNHKPIVTDDSDGLWRRLVLIPFTETIPENERDPQLTDKLLHEADGILAWAVDGCLEYQRNGLKPSAAMKRASAEYRKETDILGEWLETCCEVEPSVKIEQGIAYDNYRDFCKSNGVHPMSKKIFSRKLDERNCSGNAYIGKTRAYAGLKLQGRRSI